jgi:hypothetical protein
LLKGVNEPKPNEHSGLDLLGAGKVAKAIPSEVYTRVTATVCKTFEQLVAPLTQTTDGLGRLIHQKFDNWVDTQKALGTYASDASTYVMALNFLRNDNQKGCVNVLENSLESSLFALNHDYKTLVEQPSIYRTIKDARVYRSKYPWGQDNAKMTADVEQTITAGVNQVLSLGN